MKKIALNKSLVIVMVLLSLFVFTTMVMAEEDEFKVSIGIHSEVTTLDARITTELTGRTRINLINEPLVILDPNYRIVPGLAKEWEYNEDATELTFYLNEGIMFHHGRELVADDVKYTIDWVLNEDNPAGNRGAYTAISEVEVINDYEVKLYLDTVNTFLLNALAQLGIVPEDKAEELGEDFGQQPVGTGPYVFGEWNRDDNLLFYAFENYWQGTPNVDVVEFRPIPEDSARLLAFEAGELDIITGIVPDELARLEEDPNVIIQRAPEAGWNFVGFQNSRGPTTDLNLRKAIAHLVNREAIVDNVFQGMGLPGKSPIAPMMDWFNDEIDYAEYDLDLAREYYEQSDAYGEDIELRIYVSDISSDIRVAEILQYEINALGIENVDVIVEEWGAFLSRIVDTDDYEIIILGWGSVMGPDTAFYRQFHTEGSGNFVSYSNPRMDELLEEGRRVDPTSERSIEIYKEAQQIVHDDVPKAFIYYREVVLAHHPELTNFQPYSYTPNQWLSVPFLEKAE